MREAEAGIRRIEQDLEARFIRDLGAAPDAAAIAAWVRARFAHIAELAEGEAEFQTRYQAAYDARERRAAILELARRIGASGKQLQGDIQALNRYFDREAVIQRVRWRVGEEERAIVFALRALGAAAAGQLARKDVEQAIGQAWAYKRDPRVREAGFACLRAALEGDAARCPEAMLWQAQRAALQPAETTWAQCEALSALALASPESAMEAIRRRLAHPAGGDDVFLRRHAVRLVARSPQLAAARDDLLALALKDSSAAVRQCVAEQLARIGPAAARLAAALTSDEDPKVRAMALLQVPGLCEGIGEQAATGLLRDAIERDESPLAVRSALHAACEWAWADTARAGALRDTLQPAIASAHVGHEDLKVRRWAAAAAEQLWCAADPSARDIAARIQAAVGILPEGRAAAVPGLKDDIARDPEHVGRILSVLAQRDFGFELLPSGKVRRGERFVFRSWRVLHEWRNPGSEKRQGFSHGIGRVWCGRTIAPSAIMAELAPTRVPGEPLFQPADGNWRPWLPLPDMVLSAIDTGGVVSVYSAEGVTDIRTPGRFTDRLRARLRLSWRFADYAALRNWAGGSGTPPDAYARALAKLGVKLSIRPHSGRKLDPHAAQFFSVAPAPLLAIPAFWERAQTYFSSVYANTLGQLVLFLLAIGAYFLVSHFVRGRSLRKAREGIALVVGGWGTRGKSGTERLKAAVFSALGHPFVSKTTGNEAMFLFALPFGEVRELFLFRPYDKATIWEQMNLVLLSSKLRARVFLWECMGLTPSYVKVLQRDWMRDDISTITNTYPDHEDVQGPAGRNIPEVMTNFIPPGGALITSEEQMRPILRDAAHGLKTAFDSVGWLEAELIPDELLARFPYEEHPSNIALVTAMATRLGLEPDFAIKEMADRVVQDIGALKVYPEAHVRSRRLEFVLGNSANERFGALGNWVRVGFDRHDPVAEPDVWITTVINNRADRVPRSRVFASIIVKDISADRHVLIGSNLAGLQGFIAEAWEEFAPGISLWPGNREADPAQELEGWARRLRVVHRPDQLQAVLFAMLRAQPGGQEWLDRAQSADAAAVPDLLRQSGLPEAEGIADHYRGCLLQLQEYQALEAALRSGRDPAAIDAQLRERAREWFQRKIVVVENYHATGEQIVRQLASLTPPGFRNRIMGMQNIKGTGLDFVYRWHAWETVHRACAQALSDNPALVHRGLDGLAGFREYGVLSAELVGATIRELRARQGNEGEIAQAQLRLIERRLEEQLRVQSGPDAESGGTPAGRAGTRRAIVWLEAFLDGSDAVRRRKKADFIYRELADERISSQRAASELKALNTRQKGGWLAKDIAARRRA
ncbi:hypothetical protein [Altericroceibacterium xinjiangense]|uniref:hypothetical protein n=1 Tax=Altericroceibacterium xinjiangense TaxID=762261 RepID=UPI000F7E2214|nr:hypothetical protein [Altericroceibacterium xinjiangense]